MAIWEYNGHVTDKGLVKEGLYLTRCIFCTTELLTPRDEKSLSPARQMKGHYFGEQEQTFKVEICPTCGWWKVRREVLWSKDTLFYAQHYAAIATLRDLNLKDLSTPLEEVRSYLTAKYKARFDVHPRLFEETVGSVFKDLGYDTKVTAYSNDGGIDVILEEEDGTEVGVQVKRYKDSISVEQIRAFAGALLLNGYTKGIFVTTSSFQSGAASVARLAAMRGIQIELINAERFLDALKVSQRNIYKSQDEFIDEFDSGALLLIHDVKGPLYP